MTFGKDLVESIKNNIKFDENPKDKDFICTKYSPYYALRCNCSQCKKKNPFVDVSKVRL